MNPPTTTLPAVPSSLVPLTEDDVKRALPSHLRASVTQNMVDTLNNITNDPIIAESIRNNFISYTRVLQDGKFKTEDYVHAVAYVSYKLMGMSNKDAYAKAHPGRYATLVAKGTADKDIAAYVSAYHKGKLVNLIMEQSLVPTWVLNQDIFQKAINVQAEIMNDPDVSAKVRVEAANSLLTHLKKPEAVKGQLMIDVSESAGMKEMKELLGKLAGQQREMIEKGEIKTIDVAASRIIEADPEDNNV